MVERVGGKERLDLGERIVLFIGPEGSGKTTAAVPLAKESGKEYLRTSHMIRYVADNDPGPLGDECRAMWENSGYLSGPSLLLVLGKTLKDRQLKGGFILDGGLRTIEETRGFPKMLEEAGYSLPLDVIYLNMPDEESFVRLVTGKNARKRDDDTPERVKSRLEEYHNNLEERLEFIRNQENWRLIEVDARQRKHEVFRDVVNSLLRFY